MITGTLQRRWQEQKPAIYDKPTRTVCLDIVAETQTDEDGNKKQGWSYIPVQIDRHIDYGHIKSQLIESGFAQKDEFGLVMNAVEGIIDAIANASSWEDFKKNADAADIRAFAAFCEFRKMCADAAKEVLAAY